MTPYQIKSVMFQAHLEECRECSLAKWTGHYCEEGMKLSDELMEFFKEIERKRVAA